jgi:glycosidase
LHQQLSVFGHSSWQWHEGRQQYYLHQFVPEQPDLDYRNPEVRASMEVSMQQGNSFDAQCEVSLQDVLRFWTQKGVDGFRVDAIQTLFEVEDLSLDEPRTFLEDVSPVSSLLYIF